MKFLVIVQDLRVSGTSAGIGRRSLLAKLRKAYPDSQIDVHYIIHRDTEDKLELLPVNSIKKHIVNVKIPFYVTFLNRFYWRIFNVSLKERYIQKQYANFINTIDYKQYDHVLVTSSGVNHETIMALHGLPILRVANIIFHDPYPLFWYVGAKQLLNNLELFRLKRIIEITKDAKSCSSTAMNMSHDLKQIYNYKSTFFTLAHQFDATVFDLKLSTALKFVLFDWVEFQTNINNIISAHKNYTQKLIEDYATWKINFGTWAIVWKREIIASYSFDETLSRAQDLDFNTRIFFNEIFEFKNMNTVGVFLRYHENRLTEDV